MWYMGKAFDVKKNKAYKTMEGGLKAAKSLNLNLYDEEGKIVHQVMAEMEQEQPEIVEADISAREVENEQEGAENYAARESESDAPAIETTDDMHGSVKACDIERNSAGEAADVMTGQWDEFDGVQALRINGKIRRVFNGNLRIRNRPSWQPSAVRGISNFKEKEVTHLLEVDGKKMYRTMEGYFISADEKHVEYVGNSIAWECVNITNHALPTGSLDSHTEATIMEMFQQMNRAGKTIIIVTHDKSVSDYCNRVVVIKDGLVQ